MKRFTYLALLSITEILLMADSCFAQSGIADATRTKESRTDARIAESKGERNCRVFQMSSKDSKTDISFYGNAIVIDDFYLVTVDHAIAAEAGQVQLNCENQKLKAEVVARDFHTDLALLKVSGALSEGKLDLVPSGKIAKNSKANIIGFAKGNTESMNFSVEVAATKSDKLEVPGIEKAIELTGAGGSALSLRESLSGSAVIQNDSLIGIVSQKTSDGTVLGISASDIAEIIGKMINKTLPKRNYKFDSRKRAFYFNGLEFLGSEQLPFFLKTSGTPHEGRTQGTDPQLSASYGPGSEELNLYSANKGNTMVALQDYNLGYAVATIAELRLVKSLLPKIYEVIQQDGSDRIFITSIDGQKVKSLLGLVRILGSCKTCEIDSFWIESKHPEQIRDAALQTTAYMSRLVLSLEKTVSVQNLRPIVQQMQDLNRMLVLISNLSDQGRKDVLLVSNAKSQFAKIDKDLDKFWQSAEAMEDLDKIRDLLNSL